MDRFNALGRGMQIMLVGAVLLLIDLFFPWQDFDVGGIADELGVDATFSGWRGFAGVVLGLLTIALIAWIAVRIAGIEIPVPLSSAMIAALLGGLILAFAIIKLLTILGDEQTIWSYIGVILAAGVAFGAWQVVQGAGGMDTLRSEIPSREAATMQTSPPVSTAPPPAAPEAAPPPTAAPEPEARGSSDPEAAPGDSQNEPERSS